MSSRSPDLRFLSWHVFVTGQSIFSISAFIPAEAELGAHSVLCIPRSMQGESLHLLAVFFREQRVYVD